MSENACRATVRGNSASSSTRSSEMFRPISTSMSSWTTRQAIRPSSSAHGLPSGAAGMFTLRRHLHPGSIKSSVSSRSYQSSRSNVACIDQLRSWKPRSSPISRPVTPIQNRSDGPNLQTTFSHRSSASASEQSALTKQLHRNFRIRTLAARQQIEIEKWWPIIKAAGIKAE